MNREPAGAATGSTCSSLTAGTVALEAVSAFPSRSALPLLRRRLHPRRLQLGPPRQAFEPRDLVLERRVLLLQPRRFFRGAASPPRAARPTRRRSAAAGSSSRGSGSKRRHVRLASQPRPQGNPQAVNPPRPAFCPAYAGRRQRQWQRVDGSRLGSGAATRCWPASCAAAIADDVCMSPTAGTVPLVIPDAQLVGLYLDPPFRTAR